MTTARALQARIRALKLAVDEEIAVQPPSLCRVLGPLGYDQYESAMRAFERGLVADSPGALYASVADRTHPVFGFLQASPAWTADMTESACATAWNALREQIPKRPRRFPNVDMA